MPEVGQIKPRLLMGPGPSDVHPRVLAAMAHPTVGHMDPQLLDLLTEVRSLLQAVFRTKNEMTLAVSGTGSAGMEASIVNLIEPGDGMLVGVNGVFGARMRDVADRAGARVTAIEAPWGQVFMPEMVQEAFERHGPFKLVGLVHGETSTGACQPIEAISRIVHDRGALLLVDTVSTLGGMEVDVDGWQIDVCYSGSQKCLSCPPGLAPVTFSAAAMDVVARRETKVQSWYLDIGMIQRYWGTERVYHHTAPVNMLYGLHEALRIVLEEGLAARWQRHLRAHMALKEGLEGLGFRFVADPAHQMPMLNVVATPESVDEAAVRQRLATEFGIEIAGGLGELAGKTWRIGLMGESASDRHVGVFLTALKAILG